MRNKIILLLMVITFCFCNVSRVNAESDVDAAINKTIEYELAKAAATDVQAFVDDGLMPYAGKGPSEWLVITLNACFSNLDFSQYLRELDRYTESHNDISATDYERIALVKLCLGKDKKQVENIIDNYTGKKGIMSIIYGLMLSAYGEFDTEITSDDIALMLSEYQLLDGGFSVEGKRSDVDVTAMALQAFAPISEKYPEVIQKGTEYLISVRMSDGGYKSLGVENLESSAQVLLAFCALGDKKNAEISAEYIMSHQNSDGGFPHIAEGESNGMSSYQCLMALAAYKRLCEGGKFIFCGENGADFENITISGKKQITGKLIKNIILCAIVFLYFVILLSNIIRKKMSMKKFCVLSATAAGLFVFVFLSKIETKQEHYSGRIMGNISTVLSIEGCNGEIILDKTDIPVDDGENVFDQLINAAIKFELSVDYSGSELMDNIYVKSIDGLCEFDYGHNSGWTYTVNGEYPDKSCVTYRLKEGDSVKWIYTQDGGR